MTILDDIVAHKKIEVARKKASGKYHMPRELPAVRDFPSALQGDSISLIAEIKRHSPSREAFRDDFDPVRLARAYQKHGAAAISILTDEKFFGGRDEHVGMVRKSVRMPILRKDFIIDEIQIDEARFLGADAVLLIANVLERAELSSFLVRAEVIGLSCLVESHTQRDVEKAVDVGAPIIGINNRDLKTMKVDLTTSLRLRELIPPGVIAVSESGVESREDVLMLQQAGFDAILVGSVLMSSPDIAGTLRDLLGK